MKTDSNILIIGASRGIGAAVVQEYALRGAHVVAASRNTEALRAVVSRLGTTDVHVDVLSCDAADVDQVRDTVQRAQALLGSIDVVLYNAGVGSPAWMEDFSAEDLAQVFAVNVHGLAVALESSLPIFRRQGGGVFAGVSSLADVRGYPGSASYCSSKAAASILLESARVELRPQGIHVITVRPGFVRTAMTAKNEFTMPFMLEPRNAARRIVRGIARRKRVIHFPWPIVLATRFIRMLPNAVFEVLARRGRER